VGEGCGVWVREFCYALLGALSLYDLYLYRSSPPSVVLLSGSPVAKRVLLTTEIVVLMF
jgi:hypothetical protein